MSKSSNLGLAYEIRKKNSKKKMAEGGPVSVKAEKRPMPDQESNDKAETSRVSEHQPKDSSWTDNPTLKQAQMNNGRKVMPVKHPKIVSSGSFSVRLRDQEDDLMSSASPASPSEQPPTKYDEEGADRQGPSTPALKMKKMAEGGMAIHEDEDELGSTASTAGSRTDQGFGRVIMKAKGGSVEHEMDDQDTSEVDEMHRASMVAAIMAKRERQMRMDSGSADMDHAEAMYEGGQVEDSDDGEADLDMNAMEQPNSYYSRNEDAALRENYDEGMHSAHEPMDSNEHGDPRETDAENVHDEDLVSAIRRKRMSR